MYAVAALRSLFEVAFRLHLYRSNPDGNAGSWTSQKLIVKKPRREKVCPIPDSAQRTFYHVTTKVITLGGARGTVGWVDLWRGIVFWNVLEESPKLRGMPLPLPSKGNWSKFLNGCPYYSRDVIVNQSKDTIKYVEMEITQPTWGPVSDPQTYHQWLRSQNPESYSFIPGSWKAMIWSIVSRSLHGVTGSIDDLCIRRTSASLLASQCIISCCIKFHRDNKERKDTVGTLCLGRLPMA
ncbi:hypothetical protein BAE44_0026163 [Dichanthelium oligosanthes]|uniref:DUF1618 domain-containing protein n=1 Tax=Dichanthelium oligosanthes TaxID=888268 RepID=A0A1E5UIX4_9POAL|nr:hypothetical protein BAE44_0026163 [Dichanthelium oligosanthes]